METLTARVVGFASGSPVTYTTEVSLAGAAAYSLDVRYSTFFAAYTKLVELDSSFVFDFPKKGGFFSSPPPEERQPQLDAFVVAALAHLAKREFADELRAVLEELLDVAAHAVVAEKEEEKEEDAAHSETSESSVEEPVAEPIAQLVAAASKEKDETAPEEAVAAKPDPVVVEEATSVEVAATVEEVRPEQEVVVEEVQKEETVAVEETSVEKTEVVAVVEEETAVTEEVKVEETVVVEETTTVVEQVQVVQEVSLEQVVAEETVAVVEEVVVAMSPSSSPKKKKKSKAKAKAAEAAAAAAPVDPFAVASTVTTKTSAGGEVQHITFANGMQLKKKTLTEDQKRLRNMRRKEKRKKSSLKIRGGSSLAKAADLASSTDDSD